MPSSTYVASRPGSFSALVQAAEIGGFRLDPLLPTHVRDRYFDTRDGRLLCDGLALLVREADGRRTVCLRTVGDEGESAALPPDVDLPPEHVNPSDLPPGPLAQAVWSRVEAAHLQPLLTLRQYRTPRIATRADRAVGLVSFDVVVYDVPGAQVVTNEVEVEYSDDHRAGAALPLDAVLREHGLEPLDRSMFERGVLRLPRRLIDPVLLLPDERRRLEAAVETADTPVQRRALVVLLDAEGYRPDVIATQTGLSMDRVRYWKQQFREVRMHVLQTETPARLASRPPARTHPASDDPFARGGPPALPEPPAPDQPRPETPSFGWAEGDGASTPLPAKDSPLGFRDVSELLELFSPSQTATPLFDEAPLDEDLDLDESDDEDVEFPATSSSRQRPQTGGSPLAPSKSYPIVLGPLAAPAVRDTVPSGAEAPSPVPPMVTADLAGGDERLKIRRPVLSGDVSLLHAAQATVAYHIAAFEAAAARLADAPSETDARRLLIAAHRVRLALESFGPTLPAQAAGRLLASLRLLVRDLDEWLDTAEAARAHPPVHAALVGRQARAMEAVARRVQDDRQRAWGDRALRLLARLADQRAEGVLIGDDFPPPPDDFIGDPGDVPGPTRLRHVLASMLWSRYEAVRAFEDDLDGAVDADTAYHVTIAVSGLHFVLGLAARASSGPVREAADALNDAESALATYRHRARTADLIAEAGGEAAAPDPDVVRLTWQTLAAPPFRSRLAAVAAAI